MTLKPSEVMKDLGKNMLVDGFPIVMDLEKSRGNTIVDAATGKEYKDFAGFCKAATLEEVQKQDYKLTPGIYVGTEAEEDDGIPFEEKMETLKASLEEQFVKGELLKQQILANFHRLLRNIG